MVLGYKKTEENTYFFLFSLDSTTRSPQQDRKDRNHKRKGPKKDRKKKGGKLEINIVLVTWYVFLIIFKITLLYLLEMIPPSRPNITRLTENSVMVRWLVPENDGLQIRFFKLQYKEVGGSWNTSSDDIQMYIKCYQVDKLLPDHEYV